MLRNRLDRAERADQEILEALTSRDEVNDIPVELRTQFFKKDSTDANLSVLAHVNTQTMHFRKEGDRHLDNLTMETAIFDQDGKFVNGGKKVITMNLTDTTLEKLNHSGLSVKSSFDVKPGTYLIRLVLRDTEGAQMSVGTARSRFRSEAKLAPAVIHIIDFRQRHE